MTRPPSSGPDDFDPADPLLWPDPPEPSAAAWEKARTGVLARLPANACCPCRAAAWKVAAGVLAAGVIVVGGLWAVFHQPAAPSPPAPSVIIPPVDSPYADEVLPVATAADVMVSSVRGSEVRFGSIRHPVPDALPLASAADVTVLSGPAAGGFPSPDAGGMAVYVMPPGDN